MSPKVLPVVMPSIQEETSQQLTMEEDQYTEALAEALAASMDDDLIPIQDDGPTKAQGDLAQDVSQDLLGFESNQSNADEDATMVTMDYAVPADLPASTIGQSSGSTAHGDM